MVPSFWTHLLLKVEARKEGEEEEEKEEGEEEGRSLSLASSIQV